MAHFRQAGVLALREGLVCVVTSRDGARWVIPKGHIESGHTPAEAAAREAWEEAGLEGILDPQPIGTYTYKKNDRRYCVTVFQMTVTSEHDEWPEKGRREKDWLPLTEAARRMKEKDLRELFEAIALESRC